MSCPEFWQLCRCFSVNCWNVWGLGAGGCFVLFQVHFQDHAACCLLLFILLKPSASVTPRGAPRTVCFFQCPYETNGVPEWFFFWKHHKLITKIKATLASGAVSIESQNHVITQKLSDHGKYWRNKAINKPLPGGRKVFPLISWPGSSVHTYFFRVFTYWVNKLSVMLLFCQMAAIFSVPEEAAFCSPVL